MTPDQQPTGLYNGISTLGKVVALAAAILGTPLLYNATKGPLFSYFVKTWGRDWADLLVLTMGGIEAAVIYISVSLLFTAGVIWLITTLAMRRFRG
ncbi:MAG: hypothetical protein QM740_17840 [Acidovorax sp.]